MARGPNEQDGRAGNGYLLDHQVAAAKVARALDPYRLILTYIVSPADRLRS